MALIRRGLNGSGESERFYETYDAAEIWTREAKSVIGDGLKYYTRHRLGSALPRIDDIDNGYFADLGWRARFFDLRASLPIDYMLSQWDKQGKLSSGPFRTLDRFWRSCLTEDIVECLAQNAPTYVISDVVEGELRYMMREMFLPVTNDDGKVEYIYSIQHHDDEPVRHPQFTAANSA